MKPKSLAAVLAALLFLLLGVCPVFAQQETSGGMTEYTGGTPAPEGEVHLPDYASPAERLESMERIASSDGTTLYFDRLTGDIALQKGGEVYFSTPFDLAADAVAAEEYAMRMASQIRITYLDAQQAVGTMLSYRDCVMEKQFTTTEIPEGIQVNMTLGQEEQDLLLPLALPAASFETLILDKLEGRAKSRMKALYKKYEIGTVSEAQIQAIKEKYPVVEEMPIYVLKSVTDTEKEEIEEYLHSVGYTMEQMEQDLAAVGAEKENTDRPYFKLSVQYFLENGDLVVNLPTDSIAYDNEKYRLVSVGLLENIACAPQTSEGYIVIPDGSGAVFEFNRDGHKSGAALTFPVYGYDRSLTYTASYESLATARLPVFGMRRGETGLLGIIEEGDALAQLNASTGGSSSSYATAGVEFTYSAMDTFTYQDVNKQYEWTRADKNAYTGAYRLRFRILEAEEATYSGMAGAYRQYLIDQGQLKPSGSDTQALPYYLGLLGTVEHQERFLMVPVQRNIPLTTFADALTITDEIREAGVESLQIRYLGWANGGLDYTAFNRAKAESVLGGAKGLKVLQSELDSRGVGLYMDADLLYVSKDSWFDGFSLSRDTSRMLDKTFGGYSPVDMASGLMDNSRFRYALRPASVQTFFEKFGKSFDKLEVNGLSLGTLGSDINGDKNAKTGENRQSAADRYAEIFAEASAKYNMMTAGGNGFAFPYVQHIVDIPTESSGLMEADYSIPFLPMVLHGSVDYGTSAINLSGDPETALLKAIENGAGLYFEMAYQNASKLKDTAQMNLYSVDYSIWKDTMVTYYQRANAVLGDLGSDTITEHEYVQEDVAVITYSSGAKVAVNYTAQAVVIDGQTVHAKDFLRLS